MGLEPPGLVGAAQRPLAGDWWKLHTEVRRHLSLVPVFCGSEEFLRSGKAGVQAGSRQCYLVGPPTTGASWLCQAWYLVVLPKAGMM